ncbi:hemicentin-1-like isoform X2 [Limulus polyphemus]|uniref:Hemicentin-1-like isoform X2 n=1 Tax=Limulus polyphemus TaxID=6850 RepID=A0ABM1SCA4_LIMPO|nr:hemicentin-1-like isoform X2 [Limulus polyphemus]
MEMSNFHALFICLLFWNDAWKSQGQSLELLVSLQGVLGRNVNLPCDITPPTTDDDVTLVLWYRDDFSTPFYSLDARRGGSPGEGRHSSSDNYATRTYFSTVSKPAILQLESVSLADKGIYTCRVDFKRARTRYSEVSLSIIIPPKDPVIMNRNGEILKNMIGPFNEGDKLELMCESEGFPIPKLTWWRGPMLLDNTYGVTPHNISFNLLEISELKRQDLFTEFSCLASNNNISLPALASVMVDMKLRPIILEIEGVDHPLSANKVAHLKCRTAGSRPNVTITWWLGSKQIKMITVRTTDSTSMTISTLSFKPSKEDTGKYLSCRAENPSIPDGALERGWTLNVHHKPKLTLRLGSKLRHFHIQEGNDVYLECNIVANPWVTEIRWKFEGWDLHTNTSAGIIISNQSLVLQKVKRANRGHYLCVASNSEGLGESNSLHLKVQFSPICKSNQKMTYGAARHEPVQLFCDVEADPGNVTFHWRFNSSKDAENVLTFTSDKTRSTATVIPRTDNDYGSLLCWASNKVGVQQKPCVFKVVPEGPPNTVNNCSLRNQTVHSVKVECVEGYNGGLSQYFVMEVYNKNFQTLRVNLTAPEPTFEADNLPAGTNFLVVIYAVNAKGRSHPLVMRTSTLPGPQTQSRKGTFWQKSFSPILVVLATIVAGLIVIACITVIILKTKARYHEHKDEILTEITTCKRETVKWTNNKKPNRGNDSQKGWDAIARNKINSSVPLLHDDKPIPSDLVMDVVRDYTDNKQDKENAQNGHNETKTSEMCPGSGNSKKINVCI